MLLDIPDDYSELAIALRTELQPVHQDPRPQGIPQYLYKVPAGFPSPAEDSIDEPLDFNDYIVRNRASTFVYTVASDSLNLAGILPQDKVVIDRSLEANARDIILAYLPGEGMTLKILEFTAEGYPVLVPNSNNPQHRRRPLKEGEEMQIIGVLVGVLRRYRR